MKKISDLTAQREQFAAKLNETQQQLKEHRAALMSGDLDAAEKVGRCEQAIAPLRVAISEIDNSIAAIEAREAAAAQQRAFNAQLDLIAQYELLLQHLRRERNELPAELVSVLQEAFVNWNELEIELHKAQQKGLEAIRAMVPDLTRDVEFSRERHTEKMQQLAAVESGMEARGLRFDALRVPINKFQTLQGATGWTFKPQGEIAKALNELFGQQPRDLTGALIRAKQDSPAAANLPKDAPRGRSVREIDTELKPWSVPKQRKAKPEAKDDSTPAIANPPAIEIGALPVPEKEWTQQERGKNEVLLVLSTHPTNNGTEKKW